MTFIVIVAHALLLILAPKIALEYTPASGMASDIIISSAIDPEQFVSQTIRRALPISLVCCLLISIGCSLLFSRTTTVPLRRISQATKQMAQMDQTAVCVVRSQDEIGELAENINRLYYNLLSAIESLEMEKQRVVASERSKVDFLRAASHELKTPVTALNATLENMILGVGKYQDYETYLPDCKELVEHLSDMIHEIMETSRAGLSVENEPVAEKDISLLLADLCEPYRLIARAKGIAFHLDVSESFSAIFPEKLFRKAVSNVLANAVAYTEHGKTVSVHLENREIVIENECVPIKEEELNHLFEPFYRPDYARDRNNGGNGLGLYIVDTLLNAMAIPYSFRPMHESDGMRFIIKL